MIKNKFLNTYLASKYTNKNELLSFILKAISKVTEKTDWRSSVTPRDTHTLSYVV